MALSFVGIREHSPPQRIEPAPLRFQSVENFFGHGIHGGPKVLPMEHYSKTNFDYDFAWDTTGRYHRCGADLRSAGSGILWMRVARTTHETGGFVTGRPEACPK